MNDLKIFFNSLNIPEFNTSKQIFYKNKYIFANENELAQMPPKVPFKHIFSYYTKSIKDVRPKHKLAFVNSDFKRDFDTPKLAWLGHSSAFISFKSFKMLIDPIFSMHASPISFINRAFKEAHCFRASDFDDLSAVLISHSHFDHLDKKSIVKLKDKTPLFITPLKVGKYLKKMQVQSKIIELDWGNGLEFVLNEEENIKLFALPSQHNSNRGDGFNKSLWASFAFEFKTKLGVKKLFYSADGGYFTHFKRIGEYFGGFDLACLESGHFNKAWAHSHSFPDQIVQEAVDLKARAVMSIHWARFRAGTHGWNEPVKYLKKAFKELNIPYITPQMGQFVDLSEKFGENLMQEWWVKK